MTKKKLDELKNARLTMCYHCESDMCEFCIVNKIVDDAEKQLEEECDYIERNYSPSCPWNAPGMSIKDFI